jgi:hypothetical protein
VAVVHKSERLYWRNVEETVLVADVCTPVGPKQVGYQAQLQVLEFRLLNGEEVDVIGHIRGAFPIILTILLRDSGAKR